MLESYWTVQIGKLLGPTLDVEVQGKPQYRRRVEMAGSLDSTDVRLGKGFGGGVTHTTMIADTSKDGSCHPSCGTIFHSACRHGGVVPCTTFQHP